MSAPSTNGHNGRDDRGRFVKGNRGGPGNPLAGRIAKLRAALIEAVGEQDMREIIAGLIASAKGGDVAAAKIIFYYTVGKPRPHDDELAAMAGERFVFEFTDNLPPKSKAR